MKRSKKATLEETYKELKKCYGVNWCLDTASRCYTIAQELQNEGCTKRCTYMPCKVCGRYFVVANETELSQCRSYCFCHQSEAFRMTNIDAAIDRLYKLAARIRKEAS